mmetsp:Transcript_3026/g.6699  ORF Transcript_3026/g.6699 Transcript_3026/m.6699 type:complete len:146 (+) Transcript_3026:1474-1911(+)
MSPNTLGKSRNGRLNDDENVGRPQDEITGTSHNHGGGESIRVFFVSKSCLAGFSCSLTFLYACAVSSKIRGSDQHRYGNPFCTLNILPPCFLVLAFARRHAAFCVGDWSVVAFLENFSEDRTVHHEIVGVTAGTVFSVCKSHSCS